MMTKECKTLEDYRSYLSEHGLRTQGSNRTIELRARVHFAIHFESRDNPDQQTYMNVFMDMLKTYGYDDGFIKFKKDKAGTRYARMRMMEKEFNVHIPNAVLRYMVEPITVKRILVESMNLKREVKGKLDDTGLVMKRKRNDDDDVVSDITDPSSKTSMTNIVELVEIE